MESLLQSKIHEVIVMLYDAHDRLPQGFPDPATVLAHKLDRTNMSDIAIARGQDVAHQAAVRVVSARDLPRVLAQLLYTILMSEDILSSIISPHLRSAPPPENAEDAVEGTKASKSNHLFLLLGLAYIQDRDNAARIAREIFEPAVKLAEALYSAEKPDPETLAADIEVQRHNALLEAHFRASLALAKQSPADNPPQKLQPLGDDGSIPEYRIYAARWSLSKAPASSDCGTSSCAPLAPALDALNSADSADAPTATELPDAAKSSGEPLSKPDGSGLSAASPYLKRKKSGTGDEQDEQDEEEVFARLKRTREYTNEED